jgi:hypothetical protein
VIAATAPISLAALVVVLLVAATEMHVADRRAAPLGTQSYRWSCVRGLASGALILAILAVILHLILSRLPSPYAEQAGAVIILLLSCYFAYEFGKARNVAFESDPYRDLVMPNEKVGPGAAEDGGMRLAVIQGSKIGIAWLGASLFSHPLTATGGIMAGALVALALHGRITFRAAPSILYAGCVITTMSLGLHVLFGTLRATGTVG